MSVTIRIVSNKSELRQFIYLPEKIHRNHPQWVHPLYADEWKYFDLDKNKSFAYAETVMALAWQGNTVAGRIMGIINRRYNDAHNQQHARFCFFECEENHDVARSLLSFIENWAREKGMARLVGPLAFSDKDPQGMMIEGFGEEAVIDTNYSLPWMSQMLESNGFGKEIDLVSYKVNIPETVPAYLLKNCERAVRNNNLVVHEFTSRKQLKPWIVPVFRLINETYLHIYGFIPMTEAEMHEMADRYIPVLNPKFIKIVTSTDGELIAFLISMPELSPGIRRAKGKLWPVGWFHILREAKRSRLLTMLLGAIKESQRGKGIDALMAIKILESAQKAGMKTIDSHLVMESNKQMRAEYEKIGGTVHKRFRIFGKDL
ncbi:MAG: hypothetical protein Q8S18_09490 [Bacteroidales bacterium]|nr:hypothetical protein [Bacteroidales bacterium]